MNFIDLACRSKIILARVMPYLYDIYILVDDDHVNIMKYGNYMILFQLACCSVQTSNDRIKSWKVLLFSIKIIGLVIKSIIIGH